MQVLITGGAGFIGSHLVERCLNEGWRVTVLDDLSTGNLDNLSHLTHYPGLSVTVGSILDTRLLEHLVEGCDVVFHLAAAVGVRLVVENPVRTITTNVHGTGHLLSAVAKRQTPVIIASTSEVYGKSTALPFREDADLVLGSTTKTRWGYAASKALDEFLALAYWRNSNVPVTIVRFFNTVGPRQTGQYGMVLPAFVRQALSGAALTLHGNGQQRRCFGYVEDAVEALIRLVHTPAAVGEVVNIGNDQEITIEDLALLVKQTARSSSAITYISYEAAYGPGFEDMFRRVPCLQKLEKLTGFRPRTSIESIVKSVVEYERLRSCDSHAGDHFRVAYAASNSL